MTVCTFGGAGLFFLVKLTTGLVPGGMEGAIHGVFLGSIVGVLINIFRTKRKAG